MTTQRYALFSSLLIALVLPVGAHGQCPPGSEDTLGSLVGQVADDKGDPAPQLAPHGNLNWQRTFMAKDGSSTTQAIEGRDLMEAGHKLIPLHQELAGFIGPWRLFHAVPFFASDEATFTPKSDIPDKFKIGPLHPDAKILKTEVNFTSSPSDPNAPDDTFVAVRAMAYRITFEIDGETHVQVFLGNTPESLPVRNAYEFVALGSAGVKTAIEAERARANAKDSVVGGVIGSVEEGVNTAFTPIRLYNELRDLYGPAQAEVRKLQILAAAVREGKRNKAALEAGETVPLRTFFGAMAVSVGGAGPGESPLVRYWFRPKNNGAPAAFDKGQDLSHADRDDLRKRIGEQDLTWEFGFTAYVNEELTPSDDSSSVWNGPETVVGTFVIPKGAAQNDDVANMSFSPGITPGNPHPGQTGRHPHAIQTEDNTGEGRRAFYPASGRIRGATGSPH